MTEERIREIIKEEIKNNGLEIIRKMVKLMTDTKTAMNIKNKYSR